MAGWRPGRRALRRQDHGHLHVLAELDNETIDNFKTAQDVIDLPQSLVASFAALQADMHSSGVNTVITFDATDSITLSHVAAANLHAKNFHFVV